MREWWPEHILLAQIFGMKRRPSYYFKKVVCWTLPPNDEVCREAATGSQPKEHNG